MNSGLAKVADLVRGETGIVLPTAREKALRAALERAAPGLGADAFVRAASDPADGRDLMDRLIDEVTNQETFFLRDRGQLEEVAWHSLFQGARAVGADTIRVWSAGCATGEEAYTLALLADQAFAPAPAPVDVLGTDISGAALAAAAAGRYRERALRALDSSLRGRYFQRQPDGSYLAGDRLRRLCRFRQHNLAREKVPPLGEAGFDLVTCRNVLIYFEAPLISPVIGSLERALRPDGMLLLGAADALHRPARHRAPGTVRSAGRPRVPQRDPRPLPGHEPSPWSSRSPSREQRLAAALDAADKGDRDGALLQVTSLLSDAPLDADAHFIHGLVALEAGDAAQAAAALRRALCSNSRFALAAFTLGRAYDALGDTLAARRAYEQALRTLDPQDQEQERLLQQIDIGDIATACRTRLGGRQESS